MSRSREVWEEPEGEWETAVDKKKINRAIRRERKAEEAAQASSAAVGGEPVDEFDAAERRRRATASFYGDAKAGKKAGKKQRGVAAGGFEEAGWTGEHGQSESRPKKKKPKAAVPTYSTADELYEALSDLISRVPPSSVGGLTTTLASLGDKLATLTKKQWNKHYKADFGTMRAFLAKRPELFSIEGDNVTLLPQKVAAAARKIKTRIAQSASAGSSEESSEEDEEAEDDEEEDDSAAAAKARPQQRQQKQQQQQRQQRDEKSGSGAFGLLTAVVLLGAAVVGALVFTGQLDLALPLPKQ